MVVIITFINPVSTDELFEWGGRVFLLTGLLFSMRRADLDVAQPFAASEPTGMRRLRPGCPACDPLSTTPLCLRF